MTRNEDGYFVLSLKRDMLWSKVNYKSPLDMVQNRIYEYDLKSANTSAMRESGIVPIDAIEKIESMDSMNRKIQVGLMMRNDKSGALVKAVANEIIEAKRKLFEANNIQNHEVLAIKNDAVFIIGRPLKYTEFGNMVFRVKGDYSLFYNNDGIEMYYSRLSKTIDVKGISESVHGHRDHVNGMLEFHRRIFGYVCLGDLKRLNKYLLDFVSDYKNKKLPASYYREFNHDNVFRTVFDMEDIGYTVTLMGDDDVDSINGIFNFRKFIIPMLRMFI